MVHNDPDWSVLPSRPDSGSACLGPTFITLPIFLLRRLLVPFQGFRFSYWAFVFADVEQTLRAAGVSGLRPNAPEGFIFPKRVGERMTGAACHTEPQHRPQIMGWFFLGSSRELVDSTTPYKHQWTSPQCSAREACNSQHESCRETPSAPCQDLRSQRMNSVQAEP